jgi:DHA1 family bicyclomycin/chloramphenicol resistance-like MFS transporter
VFMDYFMTDETTYGLIFALIAAGLIGTAQINGFLLTKWGSDQIIRIALSIQSLVGLTLVLLTATGLIQLWSMVGLLFLFLSCQGLIFPNASALSMAPFSKNAGNASALMGFFQMSVGALLSALVSLFHDGTALPMTGVMAFCTLGASTVLAFGRLRLVRRASKALLAEEEAEMLNTL